MEINQAVIGRPYREVASCANLVMDCSYIAAATARLLSRFERHELDLLVFQIEVCQRSAMSCASSCESSGSLPLLDRCVQLARTCVQSFLTLLGALNAQAALVVDGGV